MEPSQAKWMLENLLDRIKTQDDGSKVLEGVLTAKELEALEFALTYFSPVIPIVDPPVAEGPTVGTTAVSSVPHPMLPESDCATVPASTGTYPESERKSGIKLDLGALSSPAPPSNVRLCLDFGTAMSKATLVADDEDADLEDIEVLPLGVPGDQEEISETMLISSVYIDNAGLLWFGKAAVDRSMVEAADGARQRLDNIKRRLSEDGWDEEIGDRFNPTGLDITQGDMVLAYLTYFTWAVTGCLERLGYPRNLPRRFAMPCLAGEQGRETVHRLNKTVGEAQVLADTFYQALNTGLHLSKFLEAVAALRAESRTYSFVAESITEPLGVAGSILSWKEHVDTLVMVVDVGAGTSDLGLFRILFDPMTGKNNAVEVGNGSRGIPVAGNHLDRMLIELIIKKSGVTSEDPMWLNIRSALELEIRETKESLFNDGFVFVPLLNETDVEVDLAEFLALDSVRKFGDRLRSTMEDILGSIDESWVKWVLANPRRNLVVALTGGGAELPMVRELARGHINVKNYSVPVARAVSFPRWIREINEDLESDYPRIAVSLGGARKTLIQGGQIAEITAGDVTQAATLGGYYVKG